MTPSEQIKAARKTAGLTTDQAAIRCGFSKSAIEKWECNARVPKAHTLEYVLRQLAKKRKK